MRKLDQQQLAEIFRKALDGTQTVEEARAAASAALEQLWQESLEIEMADHGRLISVRGHFRPVGA